MKNLARLTALTMLAACGGTSIVSDGSASPDLSSGEDLLSFVDSGAPSGPGATPVFSYPNGFASASSDIRTAYSAAFVGAAIDLTSTSTEHQAGGAWYTTLTDITTFTTDFTFELESSPTLPTTQAITFCVQNSTSATNPGAFGTNATGDANMAGYGAYSTQTPIKNSIAVKFDLSGGNGQNQYPAHVDPSATGLYIDGGPFGGLVPENDLNPSGIDLHAHDVMAVHLVYDGSLLTMTLRDTVTNAQTRTSWPVDIPAAIGGNTAYVGFTGGTIPVVAQNILTWSFSHGYEQRLPPPSFSVAGGTYGSTQSVAIDAYAGSTVYYTTDGRQPTTSSPMYTGPIVVSATEVVQAVAIEAGFTDSAVAVASYRIGAAGTPLIDLASGFAGSDLITVAGAAQLVGTIIELTSSASSSEAGAAWYVVPVDVSSFTTSFTIRMTSAMANGMTFAIQNQPPASADASILYVTGGPDAVANNGAGLGYSGSTNGGGGQTTGLLDSVAVKLDLSTGSGNTTGLYTNGALPSTPDVDMTSSGVSLHSGNPLDVTLKYDGTTLSMTVEDSVTKATFAHGWPIDIPTTVGGKTAYVGFTGGTGGQSATIDVLAWTYSP